METWRKLLLLILAVGMLVLIILTWGSIGSITLLFCLLMMGCSLLYQKYLNGRDPDDYKSED